MRIPDPRLLAPCGLILLTSCVAIDRARDEARVRDVVGSDVELAVSRPFDTGSAAYALPESLTLEQATERALRTSPRIRASLERLHELRADAEIAALWPDLSAMLQVGFPTDGLGGTPAMGGIVAAIDDLWRRGSRIRAAESRAEAAILDAAAVVFDVARDVEAAHANGSAAVEVRELARTRMELEEERARLVASLARSGVVPESDARIARTRFLRARDAHTVSIATAETSLAVLAERLGTTVDRLSGVRLPSHTVYEATFDTVALEGWPLAADYIDRRTDIRAARARLAALGFDASLTRLDAIPRISAGPGYQDNFADRPAVGPSLNVMFRSPSRARLENARADARVARALAEFETLVLERLRDFEVAHSEWRSARDRFVCANEEELPLARSNAGDAMRLHDAGAAPRMTSLDAQIQRIQAEIETIELRALFGRAHAELSRVIERRRSDSTGGGSS